MDWRKIPSLPALRAFEAAARTGSLSEAARELNVTHAAIAQHLRTVESHLGLSLMRREGRGMTLTAAGQILSGPLTDAFDQIAAAIQSVTDTDAARPLKITLTPSFAAKWLMPRLGAFWAKHADIPLSLHPDRRSIDLTREEMDLGIRFGDGTWPGVTCDMLVPASYTIVGAPSLLQGRTNLSPAQMTALPWVIEEDWPEQLAWMRSIGIDTDAIRATRVPTEELALAAARQGYGLHVELATLIENELQDGHLLAVHCDCADTLGYYLVTPPGPVKPALRTFIRWLKSVV